LGKNHTGAHHADELPSNAVGTAIPAIWISMLMMSGNVDKRLFYRSGQPDGWLNCFGPPLGFILY
jgi:hypothetical protein